MAGSTSGFSWPYADRGSAGSSGMPPLLVELPQHGDRAGGGEVPVAGVVLRLHRHLVGVARRSRRSSVSSPQHRGRRVERPAGRAALRSARFGLEDDVPRDQAERPARARRCWCARRRRSPAAFSAALSFALELGEPVDLGLRRRRTRRWFSCAAPRPTASRRPPRAARGSSAGTVGVDRLDRRRRPARRGSSRTPSRTEVDCAEAGGQAGLERVELLLVDHAHREHAR